MILTDARALVREYLDGASDPRWTPANVDDALDGQMSLTINEYTEGGGERLLELVSGTTDTTGRLDVSSYDSMHIRSVAIVQGGYRHVIGRTSSMSRRDSPSVETVEILLMRKWIVSETESDPLLYSAGAAANSWDALESLICVRAAIELATKDEDLRRSLQGLEARYVRGVMSTGSNQGLRPYRGRRVPKMPFSWALLPGEQAIQLCIGTS